MPWTVFGLSPPCHACGHACGHAHSIDTQIATRPMSRALAALSTLDGEENAVERLKSFPFPSHCTYLQPNLTLRPLSLPRCHHYPFLPDIDLSTVPRGGPIDTLEAQGRELTELIARADLHRKNGLAKTYDNLILVL